MTTQRFGYLVGLGVAGICLAVAGGLGLWGYMSRTATPLHPVAQDVPSVARPAAPLTWAEAAERARQVLRAGVSAQNLPGLSVAVGLDGELVWAEGFGWANIARRTPVTPDTRFRIGTASAVLTSAAVGLLVEQGRLRLDDEIQIGVPAFPRQTWPVTLRQVLAHTAGIRSDGGDEGPLFERHCAQPLDALPTVVERGVRFEPGTQFQLSRYGFIAVSAAIEAAAGEPFLRVMRKRVFEPLGMDDTVADAPSGAGTERATSYFPRFAADPRYGPDVMRDIDLSCYAGGGAFVSTPSDLVRFGLAMAKGTLLQPGTVEQLQASQRLRSGDETGYGLGWDLETITLAGASTRVAGHDGDVLGGMVTSLILVPSRGLVVAITSNTSYADTFGLAVQVAGSFAR